MLLLRASSQSRGSGTGNSGEQGGDLAGINDDRVAANTVPHGPALVAFVDAVVGRSEAALPAARARVLEALGGEGLVTAASVTGNFQRMVRIADGTGIPVDQPVLMATQDLRERLDLGRFGSASNTEGPGGWKRLVYRFIAPHVRSRLSRRRALRATDVPGERP